MNRSSAVILPYLVDLVEAGTENVLQVKTSLFSNIQTLPGHLNQNVLHQKYTIEGLGIRQIAKQTASSKTAVLESLKRFGIPLRARGGSSEKPSQVPFGKKRIQGNLVDFKAERRVIESVKKMRFEENLSYNAIARILTQMKIPTKKQGVKWHHEMVRNILKREGYVLS